MKTKNQRHRAISRDIARRALLQAGRSAKQFDVIVTGASENGAWVRLIRLPLEGRLMHGFKGADVGHRMQVRLDSVDVKRGTINFSKVGLSW